MLIAPFVYQADLSKDRREVVIKGKLSWLFHLVGVRFVFIEQRWNVVITILGFPVKRKKKKGRQSDSKKTEEIQKSSEEMPVKKKTTEKRSSQDSILKDTNREHSTEAVLHSSSEVSQEAEKGDSFAFKISRFQRQVKLVVNFVQRSDVRDFIKKTWHSCGKVFHHLSPKQFQLRLHFGLEDPEMTGKLLGFLSLFYTWYFSSVQLQPDFEEEILEGQGKIKGRIIPVYFLYGVLRVAYSIWKNKEILNEASSLREELQSM
jgi:hypothetical protein